MTVFLDISPAEAFNRKHCADKNDRIEQMGIEFHEKVYAGYKALMAKHPDIYGVYCGGDKYETAENIKKLLREKQIIK